MYGRRNFVVREPAGDLAPVDRLLIGVAADDVDQAHLVADWLEARHGFLAAECLRDIDDARHSIELRQDLLIKHVDLDEVADDIRARGGFVLHVSRAGVHVRIEFGDYVLTVPPCCDGFDQQIELYLPSMRDDRRNGQA